MGQPKYYKIFAIYLLYFYLAESEKIIYIPIDFTFAK